MQAVRAPGRGPSPWDLGRTGMISKMNMRKRLCLLLGLVLLLGSLNLSALAQQSIVGSVNADKVFFRMQPNADSDFYARLNKGAKVAMLDAKGDFYKVRFNGRVGYVMKRFVTLSSAAASSFNKLITPVSTSKYAKTIGESALLGGIAGEGYSDKEFGEGFSEGARTGAIVGGILPPAAAAVRKGMTFGKDAVTSVGNSIGFGTR